MKSKVLVTGGNGHLGYNLVLELLSAGYLPRVMMRHSAGNPGFDRLKEQFTRAGAEVVEADLMDPASLEAAFQGEPIVGLFHVAAPNPVRIENPDRDVVRPTLEGTQNILHAAEKHGVRFVVFTSTCSALGLRAPKERELTEDDWNDELFSPVTMAKAQTEKWVRQWAERTQSIVQVVCVPWMMGPGFWRRSAATEIFWQIQSGNRVALPDVGFHIVDARDVAIAHRTAFERARKENRSDGKITVAGQYVRTRDFAKLINQVRPDARFPEKPLSWAWIKAAAFADTTISRVFGRYPALSSDYIREVQFCDQRVSTLKSRTLLQWAPRPALETIRDTFNWLDEIS